MRSLILSLALLLPAAAAPLPAALSAYVLDEAPITGTPLLKKGDRLAICGDSITEQKRYSVMLETYLTACLPEMEITCRQFGWSGEQLGGFLKRIDQDVLRFSPTIATTCYGMNDFRYVPYDEAIGESYRGNLATTVAAFRKAGCRVVLGSPGIIDSVPAWVKSARGTAQDLNLSLCRFRNIVAAVARKEQITMADVYQPMLLANLTAKERHGPDFKVAGKDGVHPDWAGQVVMAYAFLKGLGVDGNLGSITYDAAQGTATAADGHQVKVSAPGTLEITSSRITFSPGPGVLNRDDSVRAGMALVPFDEELNRFILRVKAPAANEYSVTWGSVTHTFPAARLVEGINLANEFEENPFVAPFRAVMDAVSRKQAYETRQIKELAHGLEGAADLDGTFAVTEKARATFADAVKASHKPVTHIICIEAKAP